MAKATVAKQESVEQARHRVEQFERGEELALELYGKLQDGNVTPVDANDCIADVIACATGKQGPDALEGFRRALFNIMAREEARRG